MQEGYTQSVRCLICARPARRGATLCAQCKAAVRRARHTPNVKPDYLPHAPVVRTETRRYVERNSSYSRAPRRVSQAAATPALGGWGTYATIIAFGLAVCLTGYLAIGDSERAFDLGRAAPAASREDLTARSREETPNGREEAPKGREEAPKGREEAPKGRAAMPSLATADPDPSDEAVPDEHLAVFESLTPAPRANPDRKPAREGRGTKDAAIAQSATHVRNAGAEAPPAAVAPVAAAPAALPEPMAPDRWQQLASALSSCERENVIAGLVCKERARLQYCEGEWGAAPQCPAAVASLNTR